MLKKILINQEPWQTRVAILHGDKLEDAYFLVHSQPELERSFFKGKASKVIPGIQTAFVDIGQQRAGFLHISEVDRTLAAEKIFDFHAIDESTEQAEINRSLRQEMDINKIFKEGEEILVQVLKEPIYEKGAKLTTCFTLPGKFIVLLPNIPQIGISKKIESRTERTRLRELILQNLPKGMGVIIRTTAEERPANDIIKDLSFLISTWKSIKKKSKSAAPLTQIYKDLPLQLRAVRDHLDEDVEVVLVDDPETQKSVARFVKNYTPEQAYKVRLYTSPPPLFEKFDVEKQLEEALHKKVILRSGGSLIIETTEAMTVIDVNTGKYIGKGNLEETILKTNLEAAEEIVRQLRLRNIGGLIVIDFIDMMNPANRQKLSRHLEKIQKERDKYQSVTLKISEFGLVQMTRKRSGKTLAQQIMHVCPTCNSIGYIKSITFISFDILKLFEEHMVRKNITGTVTLTVAPTVFDYLIHKEFQSLLGLEKKLNCKLILEVNERFEETQWATSQA